MSRVLALAAFLLLVPFHAGAQTINLTTDAPGAKLYRVDRSGIRTLIGTGMARFKVEKDDPNQLVVESDGFEPLNQVFRKCDKYPKDLRITLLNRLVKVSALPYDAQILVNGRTAGMQLVDVVILAGTLATVEVKKPGFRTVSRTYRNQPGADLPPESDHFELKDRVVLVTVRPSDANILVDGAPQGERGSADVVVPYDKCVNVQVSMLGFKPEEERFCNKEQADQPIRPTATIELKNRLTKLHTTPASASIKVDGRIVGNGDFPLTVPLGQCVEVIASADGFVPVKKQYCNQTNMPEPPPEEHLALQQDEAYGAATLSDQANVNFTLEVNPAKTVDQAWSTISQIILNKFDVLEITDKETGYMRTAWEVNYFTNSTVRTRVIVKLGSARPLKYVVKIASEHAPGHQNAKDDEAFQEWGWIHNSYKDIVTELQARLR